MKAVLGLLLLTMIAWATATASQEAPPARTGAPSTRYVNPSQEINDRYAQRVLASVGNRKKEPADQVFKNLQIEWLKNVPAENLIDIMNYGYSRALGVSCTHCHVEADFASDEKRPKRAAREMAVMHRGVNTQLRQMKNLESPAGDRNINCFTCHRGAINPNKPQ